MDMNRGFDSLGDLRKDGKILENKLRRRGL